MSLETSVVSDAGGTAMIELTTKIVAAYVGNHSVPGDEIPALIGRVHSALTSLNDGHVKEVQAKPAVPIKKSITDDFLICLEDGEKFKSLRRHLRSKYDMSPEEYREKWGLPYDYPMVAPNYARQRSMLAKQMGLGQSKKSS